MAAAETAPAAGSRRPVVRSERFVQWQRELSSARRAPYGSRRRGDDGKNIGVQRESEDENERRDLRAMEGEEGKDEFRNETSNSRVKEQQEEGESWVHEEIKREISDDEHKKDGLPLDPEACPCNGQQNPLTLQMRQQWQVQAPQQPEPASLLPIKRRRRCTPSKDQELHPSKRLADSNPKVVDLTSNKTLTRSTRLLTKMLQIEEPPPPPPLKLPKLHIVLSRKEVQEDWLKMTGRRYTGKPKKSPLLHLGLGLCTSLTCPSNIRYFTDP